MNDRITITINRDVYNKLKKRGSFGETYSELILLLIKTVDAISREVKNLITNDVLEFRSKHCKINYHNQCSGKWIGLGFTITCTCNSHKEIYEKNIVLGGLRISSNTQCSNQILNLAKDIDQI